MNAPVKDSPLRVFALRIRWEFANTAFLIASIILLVLFAGTPFVEHLVATVGTLGYLGAFLTGVFFVSTFTIAPAVVVLFGFAHTLAPVPLAVVAGLGAMAGDYVMLRFVRDRLRAEWAPVFAELSDTTLGRTFASPYFAWLMPLLGAIIIASPLPDELGIGLLGFSRVRTSRVLLLTFVLNVLGILAVVLAARAF